MDSQTLYLNARDVPGPGEEINIVSTNDEFLSGSKWRRARRGTRVR